MPEDEYYFAGFSSPKYTQVPDELFDELMPRLSESELKVLLYVIRRTFGFKKDSDTISLKQMVDGIKTRDGRQLDNGTGLSRPGVTKGVRGLVAKGVLIADRNRSDELGDQPTSYQLRFTPLETVLPGGSKDYYSPPPYVVTTPPRNNVAPQETVEQQTELQEIDRSNDSNDKLEISREETEEISWIVRDLARELADRAPLKSTTTRATRLYHQSGKSLDEFLDILQAARLRTKQYTASIKTEPVSRNGQIPVKPKMGYFFGVLEDMIRPKTDQ
jgi:hypothetical protein